MLELLIGKSLLLLLYNTPRWFTGKALEVQVKWAWSDELGVVFEAEKFVYLALVTAWITRVVAKP